MNEEPPAGCDRCALGPGRWAAHVSLERGAMRCNCARGQWLQAKDRERIAERNVKPKRPIPIDSRKLAAGDDNAR